MSRSEKNKDQKCHRNVKCELNQGLVTINLYMKFNVHSSNVKKVVVLSGGQTD